MENNNEYEGHTLAELWDLLDVKEQKLQAQFEEPVNYYIPGDSMTYMSAMSQLWAIDGTRDEIKEIEAEMSRRCAAKTKGEE